MSSEYVDGSPTLMETPEPVIWGITCDGTPFLYNKARERVVVVDPGSSVLLVEGGVLPEYGVVGMAICEIKSNSETNLSPLALGIKWLCSNLTVDELDDGPRAGDQIN